ncbi:AbgT family transporter [Clostridium tetani]|uniref:AbgT family transporter n=1 Tax=Clostridium tetani TaxID=1513 RepID=UPI000AA4B3FE|nr:aminobenzoyl-glutamate transport protein [Clostridium tetani]
MKGSLKTGEKIKVSKKSGFDKFLDKVEVIGNKMPDPVTLFVGLSLMVIIISWLAIRCICYKSINKRNSSCS